MTGTAASSRGKRIPNVRATRRLFHRLDSPVRRGSAAVTKNEPSTSPTINTTPATVVATIVPVELVTPMSAGVPPPATTTSKSTGVPAVTAYKTVNPRTMCLSQLGSANSKRSGRRLEAMTSPHSGQRPSADRPRRSYSHWVQGTSTSSVAVGVGRSRVTGPELRVSPSEPSAWSGGLGVVRLVSASSARRSK